MWSLNGSPFKLLNHRGTFFQCGHFKQISNLILMYTVPSKKEDFQVMITPNDFERTLRRRLGAIFYIIYSFLPNSVIVSCNLIFTNLWVKVGDFLWQPLFLGCSSFRDFFKNVLTSHNIFLANSFWRCQGSTVIWFYPLKSFYNSFKHFLIGLWWNTQ